MTTARGSYGDIIFFQDFGGAHVPVAVAVAPDGATGGLSVGPFTVTGDTAQTDTGADRFDIVNGGLLIGGSNSNGKGAAVGTTVMWDVALNGTLTMETRVQRAAVTAGVVWAGYCDVNAVDVAEVVTQSNGTTMTLTASDLAGFLLDSQYTATADWHCPFNGGSVTGPTDATAVVTGTTNARNKNSVAVVTAVAGEYDLLQLEVFTNGTVRWRINEVLVQEQANAVSTTVDLACYVACWATTSTLASVTADYLDIRGKRNWSR